MTEAAKYQVTIHGNTYGLVIGDDAQVIQQFGDAEAQRQRVEAGIMAERSELTEARLLQSISTQTRIVGLRPDSARDFLDREMECQRMGELLANTTTRLISVIGHGGMGKTALACKVLGNLEKGQPAAGMDGRPIDGIVYMSTRTAGISLGQLFRDCARLLGNDIGQYLLTVWANPDMSRQAKVAHLLEALSAGAYVVLMDNLDDLLDQDSALTDSGLQLFIEQSVRSGQGAVLVVTTRRELALRYDVQALNELVKLEEGLPVAEGAALLRRLDRRGRLREASDRELEQAVMAVHGVPRALYLLPSVLAGQRTSLTLRELLDRFYERPDVVQELIKENYRGLTVAARGLMDALAVLQRPMSVVAVDYMLEPFAPGLNVPVLVTELMAWNIVSEDYRSGMISLHPVDQDYAYSQLLDESTGAIGYTRQALERRAAEYYRGLGTPDEMWKTIDDLVPQLAEFEHLVKANEYDEAYRVVDRIGSFLYLWGYYDRLAQMRLQLVGKVGDLRADCENLRYLGTINRALGSIDQSVEFYSTALQLARTLGEGELVADVLSGLGLAERTLGHYPNAIEYFQDALELARSVGGKSRIGAVLGHLGTTYYGVGRTDLAFKFHMEALTIARETGDRRREGTRLNSLGNIFRQQGDLDKALEYYQRGLQIAEELGHERGRGNNLDSIGGVCLVQRRWENAIENYLQALEIARTIGQRRGESHRLIMLGKASLGLGQVPEASHYCLESLRLGMAENNHLALLVLGMCYLHSGDKRCGDIFVQAQTECQNLIKHSPDTHWFRYNLGTTYTGEAAYLRVSGNCDLARSALSKAMQQYARGMTISSAPGVLQQVLLDLELIQNVVSEGLEPVFELLKGNVREDVNRGTAGNAQMKSK